MQCLVTGAAGFIGSHLCERLLQDGHEVQGIDALTDYYSPTVKRKNLAECMSQARFKFRQLDLCEDSLDEFVADADVVFHLAAMPGLTRSWSDFSGYANCNVLATQRLLDAIRRASRARLVHASTSSVYGQMACGDESIATAPISPYGVTKLAAEHLCKAYAASHQMDIVILRYFSVYGPRQRPDMGYYKFIHAFLNDQPIEVYGDGQQVRGNTFVEDCVEATVLAADARPGEIFNVGGGEAASVWDILKRLEMLAGTKARLVRRPARPGDQQRTRAVTNKIQEQLGWKATTTLDEGLARQWSWQEWDSEEDETVATDELAVPPIALNALQSSPLNGV